MFVWNLETTDLYLGQHCSFPCLRMLLHRRARTSGHEALIMIIEMFSSWPNWAFLRTSGSVIFSELLVGLSGLFHESPRMSGAIATLAVPTGKVFWKIFIPVLFSFWFKKIFSPAYFTYTYWMIQIMSHYFLPSVLFFCLGNPQPGMQCGLPILFILTSFILRR